MKLSLTVEADAVNVLALNMGRIAVDIDGIELSELIAAINQNGCAQQVAEKLEDISQPPFTTLRGICCSTAHITAEDNTLLYALSHQHEDYGNAEWIAFTGTGYLLRLNARRFPVLTLKRLGLSKSCRRLVIFLMHRHTTAFIHLDAAGELLPDVETFDW